jgi:hypothetical protein
MKTRLTMVGVSASDLRRIKAIFFYEAHHISNTYLFLCLVEYDVKPPCSNLASLVFFGVTVLGCLKDC